LLSIGGGMCKGCGNGGDGNAAGAMHLARRSPAECGDREASGDASSPDESLSSSSPSSPPSM
nr:hypothetical protein [Tanacetum cinerariifolium]